MINEVMFFLIGAMILIFSVLTVTSRRILRAAVYLLFVLISTAGLYFMLSYNFLAAVQLRSSLNTSRLLSIVQTSFMLSWDQDVNPASRNNTRIKFFKPVFTFFNFY